MAIKIKRKVRFKSKESLYKWLKQRKHVYREDVAGPYRLYKGMLQHKKSYGWYSVVSPMSHEIFNKLFYKYDKLMNH